jgi:hypothetical protein
MMATTFRDDRAAIAEKREKTTSVRTKQSPRTHGAYQSGLQRP